MSVTGPRVLISGASVAGPVLAYWLERWGFVPTVIERASELRASGGGHAVDLFGPALDVMDWLGVLPRIEAARTRTRLISFVRAGRRPIAVSAETLSEGVSERHIEIMRGDLARIVNDRTREHVQYVFDDSIATLHDTGAEVEVTFDRGAPQTYDLVIGADGLHSHTRSLVFGAEQEFLHFLGGYLAVFTVPRWWRPRARVCCLRRCDATCRRSQPVHRADHFCGRSFRRLGRRSGPSPRPFGSFRTSPLRCAGG